MSIHYSAAATTVGGRNGHVDSADGLLHFDLSIPKSMGGPGKEGTTNPEQLFACGYSACFGSAIDFVASQRKMKLAEIKVTADVTIDMIEGKGFQLSAKLTVALPGVDHATAEALVAEAHQVCPYSKATRGNITVDLVVA